MGPRRHHLHPFELGPDREHLYKHREQAEAKSRKSLDARTNGAGRLGCRGQNRAYLRIDSEERALRDVEQEERGALSHQLRRRLRVHPRRSAVAAAARHASRARAPARECSGTGRDHAQVPESPSSSSAHGLAANVGSSKWARPIYLCSSGP